MTGVERFVAISFDLSKFTGIIGKDRRIPYATIINALG